MKDTSMRSIPKAGKQTKTPGHASTTGQESSLSSMRNETFGSTYKNSKKSVKPFISPLKV